MAFPVDQTTHNTTGSFGPRKPIKLSNGGYSGSFHYGHDLAPEVKGSREIVYAIGKGKIHSVGRKADAGIFVILRLESGDLVRYCHLSTYGVRAGQDVADGQPLGREGATGNVNGVHLHIEVYPDGQLRKRIDPKPFFWNEWNPARGKATSPAVPQPTPAPAPAPAPTRPAPTPSVVIGSRIKLKDNWAAYRYADLRGKITGGLAGGIYRVIGIVNGNLHLTNGRKAGWVHRDAQKGLVK